MREYRRDIDGLRALAVLPVLLFHGSVPGFAGGFVGVDVFFVLSGFLITSIILSDMKAGAYSIVGFYERRVRRIFPALFVMTLATAAAALFIMTPDSLRMLGKSVVATILFASNFLFYSESGYFASAAEQKPLLHTWSLAVEEQFYIFWPPVLWAIRRYVPRALPWVMALVLAASFALAIWQSAANPTAAFYLPLSRTWELMLGALLAVAPAPVLKARWLREALAAAGVVLILVAVFTFDKTTRFPGPMAAVPCLGALLCILANGQGETFAGRLLSTRPLVFVGLISYSLYLWHWPLLAFGRYLTLGEPALALNLTLLAASGVLAWLSYRFVEQPVRRRAGPARTRSGLFAGAGVISGGLIAVGAVFFASGGLPARADGEVLAAEAAARDLSPFNPNCRPGRTDSAPGAACRSGPKGPEEVVLWGDSHAAAFAPVVARAADAAGLRLRVLTLSAACPPLVGVTMKYPEKPADPVACARFNKAVLDRISASGSVKTVVLVGRWALHTETTRVGAEDGGRRYLVDGTDGDLSVETSRRAFAKALPATIAAIREAAGPDVRIVIVGQAPEPGVNVSECLARALFTGGATDRCLGFDRETAMGRLATSNRVIGEAAAADPGVSAYFLSDRVCDAPRCLTKRGDVILYSDDDHLSRTGALDVARDFDLSASVAR